MKAASFLGAGVLLLLLGASSPAYAQEQHDKDQGKSDQNHEQSHAQPQHTQPAPTHQVSRPAPAQTERPGPAYGGQYHGGVRPTETNHAGVHPSGVPQHSGQVRSGFVQSRAKSWKDDHRTWQQRGGYTGYRIPDDRFRGYFGHDHFFRISRLPLLFVGGSPRFQYDGYWITFVDPWPDNWPPTWYETDDCYLDYNGDGYYLYDNNYPGIGIAVTISF